MRSAPWTINSGAVGHENRSAGIVKHPRSSMAATARFPPGEVGLPERLVARRGVGLPNLALFRVEVERRGQLGTARVERLILRRT